LFYWFQIQFCFFILKMGVENQRRDEDGVVDRFPVGMRVLAVDDNPTCLKVLAKLLSECKYHG
jgi:two-component response regulator ARR-B family